MISTGRNCFYGNYFALNFNTVEIYVYFRLFLVILLRCEVIVMPCDQCDRAVRISKGLSQWKRIFQIRHFPKIFPLKLAGVDCSDYLNCEASGWLQLIHLRSLYLQTSSFIIITSHWWTCMCVCCSCDLLMSHIITRLMPAAVTSFNFTRSCNFLTTGWKCSAQLLMSTNVSLFFNNLCSPEHCLIYFCTLNIHTLHINCLIVMIQLRLYWEKYNKTSNMEQEFDYDDIWFG